MNKNLFKEINTERLLLKKYELKYAERIYNSIYNDFEYYKYYYQVPFNSYEDYEKIVKTYDEKYKLGNHFRWIIIEKETNEPVGLIQLHSIDVLNNCCKLGYVVSYNHKGKGYIKESIIPVIDFAFNILKIHKIEAEVVEENIDSIKLLESLNIKCEYEKKSCYKIKDKYYNKKVYSIINNNY